jgi:hypothetical protein
MRLPANPATALGRREEENHGSPLAARTLVQPYRYQEVILGAAGPALDCLRRTTANDEGHGYAKKKNQDLLFDAETLFIRKNLLDQN